MEKYLTFEQVLFIDDIDLFLSDNSTCDEPLPTQAGDVEMVSRYSFIDSF